MKTKVIRLTLALMTITGATAQPDGPPEGHRPPPVPPLLAIFDTDHDGVLSTDEIQNAAAAFGKLDANDDGEITREEMHPPMSDGEGPPDGEEPQGPPPGKRPTPPIITALDADHDGTISATELEAAPESLKTLDKNDDGELSPQELHPRGPRPPQGEGKRDGRRPSGPPPEDEPPIEEE